MLRIEVVPRAGRDAYELLREHIAQRALTWVWKDTAQRLLQHIRKPAGHILLTPEPDRLIAEVVSDALEDRVFLAERFVGRLLAWLATDLESIHLHLNVPLK